MITRFAAPTATCATPRTFAATIGLAALVLGFGWTSAAAVCGADWPTYRHDVARSGITAEAVAPPLTPVWVFRARHAPQPAWGDPKPGPVEDILELRRRHFDDVFQPVIEGDAVFFGSSGNHKVYCLDAGTGAIRWTKITGGPVRLAPALVEGRVYVASDDGLVYCLDARQGQEIWKLRAAPEDRRVLGHGKMISLWPPRTGVLVDSGLAYFGAGIFPAIFLAICLPAACSGQSGRGDGRYRTFTDSRGRTVQARVLDVDGDKVTIERRDGKSFTLAISAFSQADQDFLRRPVRPEPAAATGRDWPRFRGPSGMGISDATGLPVEWDQNRGIVWKTALPGAGASSPITFGDRIYLTSYTGYFVPDEPGGSLDQLQRHLIALQLDDGRIVWDKAVAAKLPEEERIRDHGFAANSVAVDADRVYAFFGKTGVFAFDHDGNQLWQADVGLAGPQRCSRRGLERQHAALRGDH